MILRKTIIFSLALLGLFCPSPAGIRVEGKLTHEKEAEPGEIYKGVISIRNPTAQARAVRLYLTDYHFTFDGGNDYGEPGKSQRSNASWITLSPQRVTLPPTSVAEVHYSVRVPEDNILRGTYWCMIMAEELSAPPSAPVDSPENKPQVGLSTVLRYGIQMVTHIGNTGISKLRFLKTELLKEKGMTVLQTDIENTGERWLRPSLSAELYDDQGKFVGKFTGGQCRLYPETSVKIRIDLGSVPKGKYRAVIIADNGDENVFGAQYTLSL